MQQSAFDRMKQLIKKAPYLTCYDPSLPLCTQCGSSQCARSRSPTKWSPDWLSQQNVDCLLIKIMLLAFVYIFANTNGYTFIRLTHLYSDHNPLIMIVDRPPHGATRRLQSMTICPKKYRCEMHCQKVIKISKAIRCRESRYQMPKTGIKMRQ